MLIGVIRSTSSETLELCAQFLLTNNIFYSIKQVASAEPSYDEINCGLKLMLVLWETRGFLNKDLQVELLKETIDTIVSV